MGMCFLNEHFLRRRVNKGVTEVRKGKTGWAIVVQGLWCWDVKGII